MPEKILFVYIAVISIVSVIYTIADKIKARHGKWRIPESTLFLLSLFGGSCAMLITMLLIRHKTRHLRFMIGIPLIILLQIAVVLSFLILI